MLAAGRGHELYDAGVQGQYQARYAGRIGTLYIHPPFEALIYLAVAWLPLRAAYLVWFFLSLIFLAAATYCLAREALGNWDWRLLFAASLIFVPVLLCLAQGQDSLLLLLFIALAFTRLRQNRAFAAGCWLGLGLFKFQIVLPLALALLLAPNGAARRALAKGLGLVALALALLSAALCGWPVFQTYPAFLFHLPAQDFSGIFPRAMANFRGLAWLLFRDSLDLRVAAVALLSSAAFVKLLFELRRARPAQEKSAPPTLQQFDSAFAAALLFALLVSYHLNPHDLTLLLLPIVLLLHGISRARQDAATWATAGLLAILFAPLIHIWALRVNAYGLLAIPMLLLFMISGLIRRPSDVP